MLQFEEVEVEDVKDDCTTLKLAIDPSDMSVGKLVTLSDTEEELIVYHVIEGGGTGDYTQIHLLDTEHEHAL